MKFRGCDPCDPNDPDAEEPCVPGVDDVARISNVLYENIYIEQGPNSMEKFWLELKDSMRFHFDSDTCLNYPYLNFFLVRRISIQNSSDFLSQNSS